MGGLTRIVRELGVWLGVVAVVYGAWLMYPPVAWIVAGLAVGAECGVGLALAPRRDQRTRR